MENQVPTIGTPATEILPDDRYPFVVVAVSKSGHQIVLAGLDTDFIQPSHYHGPWPVYDHTYTPEEIENARRGDTITAHRRKNGQYQRERGVGIQLGKARYYRDFSD